MHASIIGPMPDAENGSDDAAANEATSRMKRRLPD
jgi:hypothetical protein